MQRHRASLAIVLAALALSASGCAEEIEQSPLAPVSGTVKYKGTPLASGTITFLSEKSRPATGKIKDGQIVDVTTYEKTGDGAPVGNHRVTIFANEESKDPYATGKSLIPTKYNNPDTSGLTADVKQGAPPLNFDLKD